MTQSLFPTFTSPSPDTITSGGRNPTLADRYLSVPFTLLDARTGWWRERKAQWLATGIQSELGRSRELLFASSAQPPATYTAKNAFEAALGRKATWAEFAQAHPEHITQQGTSVFDPVLCELVYRWFSAPGQLVLDPFAGGSVRGIVAAATGRRYAGVDLRAEQVDANRAQWATLAQPGMPAPHWVQSDALALHQALPDVQADFLFSCPPYGNLERYSDDKADLSTMRYPQFLRTYRKIIKEAVAMLRQDRFACFVVGDIRDTQGLYRGFVSDTIAAFRDAGARLYNEAILVTPSGSLPIRAGKAFEVSRKLGKTHQQVLVFVKGDPRRATAACGAVR
ncbi:MAG: DNA methyltransferase [Simplicispira sp.]|uniref:DNA methyltransferase n=1 Tax=Simplicispira sp. TaxID=2015802 RepID=UPI00258B47AB|nr:DNA methyltransferase [Simplicispira sp.]MDD2692954.1 DNA methyltransferase [Simplicispira sp.]